MLRRSYLRNKTPMTSSVKAEPKEGACAWCGGSFLKLRPLQSVCKPLCGQRKARADRLAKVKAEREDTKARKEKLKSIGKVEEECREIVQKIARIRDRHMGCISCEKPADWDGQWHGSHYRAHGGCSSIQFHLWNINRACWICNKLYSGRVDMQKVGIVARYGQERLDWLDAQPKSKKYSREYLARFKKVMGKRCRRLEKRMKEEA